MFGARYSRLKFWIVSIFFLIPTGIMNTLASAFESAEKYNESIFMYALVAILSLVWINTLANRIRDYGSNPWLSAIALLPLANIVMTLYFGIVKTRTKE